MIGAAINEVGPKSLFVTSAPAREKEVSQSKEAAATSVPARMKSVTDTRQNGLEQVLPGRPSPPQAEPKKRNVEKSLP